MCLSCMTYAIQPSSYAWDKKKVCWVSVVMVNVFVSMVVVYTAALGCVSVVTGMRSDFCCGGFFDGCSVLVTRSMYGIWMIRMDRISFVVLLEPMDKLSIVIVYPMPNAFIGGMVK